MHCFSLAIVVFVLILNSWIGGKNLHALKQIASACPFKAFFVRLEDLGAAFRSHLSLSLSAVIILFLFPPSILR